MSALRWALRFGRRERRGLAAAVALGALAAGAAVGLAAVSAWLIARASQHPPVLHLMVAIVSVRALGASRGLFRYLERLTGHSASFRILGDLRAGTVERLEQLLPDSATGPGALSSGDLLARFVGDVDGLQDLWARVVVPAASAAIVGVGAVVLVTQLAPAAGLVLGCSLVAAAVGAPLASQRAARGAGRRFAPLRGRYQTELVDLLDGATELAVYGALPDRLQRLDELDGSLAAAEARSATAAGLGSAIAVAAGGVATLAGLAVGAQAVAAGDLAPVNVAVVALVPLAMHEIAAGLAAAAHRLPELGTASARVREVFERAPAVTEPAIPLPLPAGPYGLRLRGLTAAWTGADGGAGPVVLRDVDADLAAGSRTLVVGPSGSGKSTLAAILLRFLEPTAGSVSLVGPDRDVDVRHLATDDVRSVVGWCAQDAHLFDSTIGENLRLARPDATALDLWSALDGAGLATWVGGLPDGLDTMVGEHGRRLSGGQRQRLALARVLLADRLIVVLDEPTEHLDDPTARALAHDLVAATEGRTVIVLTHRPELFPEIERTLRIDAGHRVALDAARGVPALT